MNLIYGTYNPAKLKSMKKKLTLKNILITYVVFMLIWIIRIYALKPYIDSNYGLWGKQIINGVIKTLIWGGISIYLIKKYDVKINLKEMFTKKFSSKKLLIFIAIAVAYHLMAMFSIYGKWRIHPGFHPSQLISQFLIVGILEELLFRGWFFNALSSITSDKKANIIASIFFLTIHYPSYIYTGSFFSPSILYTSASIFILGIAFGWMFRKSKNILMPTIVHSVWDLMELFVYGF